MKVCSNVMRAQKVSSNRILISIFGILALIRKNLKGAFKNKEVD